MPQFSIYRLKSAIEFPILGMIETPYNWIPGQSLLQPLRRSFQLILPQFGRCQMSAPYGGASRMSGLAKCIGLVFQVTGSSSKIKRHSPETFPHIIGHSPAPLRTLRLSRHDTVCSKPMILASFQVKSNNLYGSLREPKNLLVLKLLFPERPRKN